MSSQRQVVMESSLALGRLDLNPCSAAVSVNLARRLSGGPPALDKCGQRAQGPQGPQGPQGQTHLNGCVPLSHQVAGHKYGVDKVGKLTELQIFSCFFFLEFQLGHHFVKKN